MFQWFSFVQLTERFKETNRTFGIDEPKAEFEIELCDNVIAKTYNFLFRFETEKEEMKENMRKWLKPLGILYQKINGKMKGLKFTLHYN